MVNADSGVCWWALELTAPADRWGRGGHWPEPIVSGCLQPQEDIIAFVTLGSYLEGFCSKARPEDCPAMPSPPDIFLLHQFANWPLLDFSRL